MKIALVSASFHNKKTDENIQEIAMWVRHARAHGADMVVFGESALQGFDALSWNYAQDMHMAEEINGPAVKQLQVLARTEKIAISLGLFERTGETLYSSQLTVDHEGQILQVFRRVSPGWKTEDADQHYREGGGFSCFEYMGKRMAVALCGDLWYGENVCKIAALAPDILLWPVYCDYLADEWNEHAKYEYASQAAAAAENVLWVNPYCADMHAEDEPIAVGGAVHFHKGNVAAERAAGAPGMMITEI